MRWSHTVTGLYLLDSCSPFQNKNLVFRTFTPTPCDVLLSMATVAAAQNFSPGPFP